jgi:two-component sensor histidine kinase
MSQRRARYQLAPSAAPRNGETPRVRYEADIAPSAQDVHDARSGLRSLLDEFSLPVRTSNAALVVAHELLLNALQHGAPPIRLTVEIDDVGVLVEVHDGSAAPARSLPYRPGVSERGLGLRLVRQLASDWGQDVGTAGKTVWARVR